MRPCLCLNSNVLSLDPRLSLPNLSRNGGNLDRNKSIVVTFSPCFVQGTYTSRDRLMSYDGRSFNWTLGGQAEHVR